MSIRIDFTLHTLQTNRGTRAALTGKHDTLVRRAHQMLNAALRGTNRSTQKMLQAYSCQIYYDKIREIFVLRRIQANAPTTDICICRIPGRRLRSQHKHVLLEPAV